MIFTTNDKGKILLLAFLVVVLVGFVFWQWLNFLPTQKMNRVDNQDSIWQSLSSETSGVMDDIKDALGLGQKHLGVLGDELQRQADQDAVVSAIKDRLAGQATSTTHICNRESDCGEGNSCLVGLSDEEWERLEDGASMSHFGKPTFCKSHEDLLGCLFYAMEDGAIREICID
jgi:hypothetical protein